MKYTRRTALGILTAGSLTAASCSQDRSSSEPSVDVIVLGAGLSGLHAARLLEQAGLETTVLEASSRIGGRMMTLDDLPGRPEAGGSQVGRTYARIRSTAQELGLSFEDQAGSGFGEVLHVNGTTLPSEDWITSPANALPEPLRALPPHRLFFGLTARRQPLDDVYAWREPASVEHDVDAEAFLRQLGADDEAIRLMNVSLNGGRLDTYSMLNLWRTLAVFAAERGLGGSQHIVGGSQRLPEAMAASLSRPVRLDSRVVGITDTGEMVTVTLADGSTRSARFLVSALGFSVLRHLDIEAPLAEPQREAINGLPYTPITQLHLECETPFWESDGLAPDMWTDGPLERIFAGYGPDGAPNGMLTCWLDGLGSLHADTMSVRQLEALARAELRRMRPASEGRVRLRRVVRWNANNPVSGGAYMHWAPGQIHRWAEVMVRPAGRVHFAGEHASHLHTGMEGAMEAGERAALEILDRAQA